MSDRLPIRPSGCYTEAGERQVAMLALIGVELYPKQGGWYWDGKAPDGVKLDPGLNLSFSTKDRAAARACWHLKLIDIGEYQEAFREYVPGDFKRTEELGYV